jgi:tellurite resistance protein TerC
MSSEIIFFGIFIIFVVGMLLLDLLIIGKGSHEVSVKEAAVWSTIWIALALLFSIFLRYHAELVHGIRNAEGLKVVIDKYSPRLITDFSDYEKALDIFRNATMINYLSGYLIEKSLSVDNLFVIMAILSAFSVRKEYYKPVLFWGILGAIVMRFIFIFAGASLINRFGWLLYIFGAYLVYTGVKMYLERNKEIKIEPQNHPLVKFLSKRMNVLSRYVNGNFTVIKDGKLFLTPLFVVLIIIEFTDLVFAMDSIPAIFAVSRDPYIVFFSNIFAILGLRSLFFLLIKVVEKFYLLKAGVAILLVYVGAKLLLHDWLDRFGFKPEYSLYIILAVLAFSIVFSLIFPKDKHWHERQSID